MYSKYIDEFIFLTQRNNSSTWFESFIRIDSEKENDESYVISVVHELRRFFGENFTFKIQDRRQLGGAGYVIFYRKNAG